MISNFVISALKNDIETLFEILLSADRFCSSVEISSLDIVRAGEYAELRSKLLQCRAMLQRLQKQYEKDELTIQSSSIRDQFRHLLICMMWIAFYARSVIDRRAFRRLVVIESAFTHLLSLPE